MFANRYTALIDACSLADALRRDLLLSLAEAEFFRVRWSDEILEETSRAICGILCKRGLGGSAALKAERALCRMRQAFPEADVGEHIQHLPNGLVLPDDGDLHVVSAALKAQAQTIVTENLADFPNGVLHSLGLEARSSDDFIADTIALDEGRAVKAVAKMRARLHRPELTPEKLLQNCEGRGLLATAAQLYPFVHLI